MEIGHRTLKFIRGFKPKSSRVEYPHPDSGNYRPPRVFARRECQSSPRCPCKDSFPRAATKAGAVAGFREFVPQRAIARHAAGRRDATHAQPLRRADRFGHEHFHDGGLHAGAEIAQGLGVVEQARMVAQKIADGRFQAAEAEVVVRIVQQRTREIERLRIPLLRQPVNFRARRDTAGPSACRSCRNTHPPHRQSSRPARDVSIRPQREPASCDRR